MKHQQAVHANSRPRLEWTLATALGFVVGMGLSFTLFLLLDLQIIPFTSLDIIVDVLSMILIGMSVGWIQWLVIRKYLPRERRWILITTLGWVIALILVQVLYMALRGFTIDLALRKSSVSSPLDVMRIPSASFYADSIFGISQPFQFFLDQSDLVNVLGTFLLRLDGLTIDHLSKALGPGLGFVLIAYIAVFGGLFGAIIGSIVGSMQSIVLRNHYPDSGRWITKSAAGWAMGWGLNFVCISISFLFVNRNIVTSTSIVGLVVIGIIAGVLPGKELERWIHTTGLIHSASQIRSAIESRRGLPIPLKISALLGVVFLFVTVCFGLFLFSAQVGANLFGGIQDVRVLALSPSSLFSHLRITPSSMLILPPPADLRPTLAQLRDHLSSECDIELRMKADNMVMKEKSSTALSIKLLNPSKQECFAIVSLYTPNFDHSPAEESQSAILAAGSLVNLGWVISPKTTGSYQIGIDVQIYPSQSSSVSRSSSSPFFTAGSNSMPRIVGTDIGYVKYIGVVVTNSLGLTVEQAATLTYVGTFLGSSFTLPWLYTVWKEHRKNSSEEKKRSSRRKQKM